LRVSVIRLFIGSGRFLDVLVLDFSLLFAVFLGCFLFLRFLFYFVCSSLDVFCSVCLVFVFCCCCVCSFMYIIVLMVVCFLFFMVVVSLYLFWCLWFLLHFVVVSRSAASRRTNLFIFFLVFSRIFTVEMACVVFILSCVFSC